MRKGIIDSRDKEGIALIERRLAEHGTYVTANKFYHENKGHKIVDRFRTWMLWVFKNRELIFQILGIAIMFLDDGTPRVVDARDKPEPKEDDDVKVKIETVHGVKTEVEVPDTTPDGEPVEDFVKDDEVPNLHVGESVVPRDYSVGLTRLHELNEVQPDEQDSDEAN